MSVQKKTHAARQAPVTCGGGIFSGLQLSVCLTLVLLFDPDCSNDNRGEPEPHDAPLARIVSLSPSITREIMDLGCGDLVAGVTSHQPEIAGAALVGGYLHPNFEKIITLKPDAVLCSDEDGAVQRVGIHSGVRVIRFSRNSDFESLCGNYLKLAGLLNRRKPAEIKIAAYRKERARYRRSHGEHPVIACFISTKPLVAAGDASFIGGIIRDAGGRNAYRDADAPYPIVALESLVARNPDIIISTDDGPRDEFMKSLSGFDLHAVKNKGLYFISPDHISYYTPADYIASIGIISGIIEKKISNEKK